MEYTIYFIENEVNQCDLAGEYPVSQGQIGCIVRGEAWTNVDDPIKS
ncbi:hypothetical protein GGP85_002916 [Salinibacter ruber]|jgi:hypothetical protein|nr:hypothetical protein [Salinibacter ruber]MCS3827446.1 hypothetical protein [Salinibacter ruber]